MYIPGHLSVAYLVATAAARREGRPPKVYTETAPLLLGALTPDLVDKPLFLLQLTDFSRTIAHSLLVATVLGAVYLGLRLVRRDRTLVSVYGFWLVGLLSHFVADFFNDILRGLLDSGKLLDSWFAWPLLSPDDWKWLVDSPLFPGHYLYILPECVIIVVALWAVWSNTQLREGR